MIARDIMDTKFNTLHPDDTIDQAIAQIHQATIDTGKTVFGLMVLDDEERLIGMLSIYDILLFIKPKHIRLWSEMTDLDPAQLMSGLTERVKSIQVGDLMATELTTVSPETPLMKLIDIMINQHIRRLPVLEEGRVIGIVYIAGLFNYLFN